MAKTIDDILFEMYFGNPINENNSQKNFPFWHYTSASGLMGILESGRFKKIKLWYSHSDCLNDLSEGKHVISFIKELSESLAEKNEISDEINKIVSQITIPTDRLFIYRNVDIDKNSVCKSLSKRIPCEAFICCFSLKDDSLDMWRYYSKADGGYALKLYPVFFDQIHNTSNCNKETGLLQFEYFQVIYDDKEKKNRLRKILVNADSGYKELKKINIEPRQYVECYLTNSLKELQFQFKHQCFSSEQESRIVAYRPITKPGDYNGELETIHFRSQKGMIVPYLELETDISCLLEIKISPFLQDKNTKQMLESFVRQCGCTRVKISNSNLPVR